MRKPVYCQIGILVAALLALAGGAAYARLPGAPPAPASPTGAGATLGSASPQHPYIGHSVQNDTSPPLRSIPAKPQTGELGDKDTLLHRYVRDHGRVQDPVIQQLLKLPIPNSPAPIRNFEGVHNLTGSSPPDTEGDVGPNNYVQWVNTNFQVFDKGGSSLYGPVPGNTLWTGFGGPCEFQNAGDPIALYDPLADRWLMSQFGWPVFETGPYYQCIAISATPDPLGAWHRYAFVISNTLLNDYPHFGVWPEAYYASFHMFDIPNGETYAGGGFAAFDRAQMLAGQPATFQMVISANDGGQLPSDLDGHTPPPPGAPNMYVEPWDNVGQLRVFDFHADFNNPAATSFTGPYTVTVAPWNWLCLTTRNCIPQPGTSQKLDGIGDRFMYRLAYRNFGDHESWVTNMSVDASPVTNTVQSAVRWYELRNSGVMTPTLYQEGTYAGDTQNSENRWMGSVAMDGSGDLMAGYSVSSGTVYPSIRYTGRLVTDTLGTLPQGESTLITGTGTQAGNRWGDYSMMSVDPVDDCTFWYTNEYYQISSGVRWQTRIGSFKFGTCGANVTGTATAVASGTAVATVTPHSTATSTAGVVPSATSTPSVPCSVASPVSGAIQPTDPTFLNRFNFDAQASECDFPKPFEGILGDGQARHYDAYTYYNDSDGPQCITISIQSACNYYNNTRIGSATYLGSFNPANLEQNWLGDDGYNVAALPRYQVTVPARSTYVVVVFELVSNTFCPSYTLTVSCGVAGGTPTASATAQPSATHTAVPSATRTPAATSTPCTISFSDVHPTDYFYEPVRYLYCHGVISGYADNTFRPYNFTTRSQMVKIVVLGFNKAITTPPNGQYTFTDVPPANPFFQYIETAASLNIVSGYTCGGPGEPCDPDRRPYFRPYVYVTRGQLSKIDVVAAGWGLVNPPAPSFADVLPNTAFYPFVETAYCHGVISGYSCGGPGEPCDPQNRPYFRQFNNATRGQIAKIVYLSITASQTSCALPTVTPVPSSTATPRPPPTRTAGPVDTATRTPAPVITQPPPH